MFTDVIFLTETWLSPHSMSNHYTLPGYSIFHSFRSGKGGEGALIFIRDSIPSAQLSPDVTPNNANNVCVVTASQGRNRVLLLAVYRPTSTTTVGTDEMCDHIDNFAMHYNNIVMAGDFNFSGMQWSDSCPTNDSYCQSILRRLMVEHHLIQTVTQPTQGNAILDLMFVSDTLTIEGISYLAPINCSEHDSQLLHNCES